MQAIKRRRLGTDGWQGLLAQFVNSGLTVSAFCAREGVSTASFYRWRSQFGAESEVAQRLSAAPVVKRGDAKTAFVDLGALSRSDALSSRFELRLDLGGGLLLSLVRG
jgi:putative transposase